MASATTFCTFVIMCSAEMFSSRTFITLNTVSVIGGPKIISGCKNVAHRTFKLSHLIKDFRDVQTENFAVGVFQVHICSVSKDA